MFELSSHPDADLALELLCTLPVEPDCVPISELANDFGFPAHGRILTLIDELRKRKYLIQVFRRPNGALTHKSFKVNVRCVAIARSSRIKTLADCERYWDRIHGNPTAEPRQETLLQENAEEVRRSPS